jgi:hypothetical protein
MDGYHRATYLCVSQRSDMFGDTCDQLGVSTRNPIFHHTQRLDLMEQKRCLKGLKTADVECKMSASDKNRGSKCVRV